VIENPKAFFDGWREAFGPMSVSQVGGINVLLGEMSALAWPDPRWWAYDLATAYHETGGQMVPVKETVFASSADRNPSDDDVKAALEHAWKAGRMPWVKTPYWREGWFGRGLAQLSHEVNYRKLGDRLGVDLVGFPDQALDPAIAARILCVGMAEGLFTGKSLADYFDSDTDDPRNARRIVNGMDRAALIASYHRKALTAVLAGWGATTIDQAPIPSDLVARLDALEVWAASVNRSLDNLETRNA
jgi:hypothetical protein